MDSIRIIQLPTKSAAGTDDYIAVDSTANGTKKIQFPNLLDNGLTIQNKAADAKATGDAISEVNGAIGNEASTRQSADANLQTQIDQLIAPSGEAPSAAEIENARIGAPPENTVYSTLGDAIRGQFTNLKNVLNDTLFNNAYPQSSNKYVWGNYNLVTGEASIVASPYKYVIDENQAYIKLLSDEITVNIESGYKYRGVIYNADKTFKSAFTSWTSTSGKNSALQNNKGCYVRLIISKTDESAFSQTELDALDNTIYSVVSPVPHFIDVEKNTEILSDIAEQTSVNILDPSTFIKNGYYLDFTDGTTHIENNVFRMTADKIHIGSAKQLFVIQTFGTSSTKMLLIYCYSDASYLGYVTASFKLMTNGRYVFDLPEGTTYVRVMSNDNTTLDGSMLCISRTLLPSFKQYDAYYIVKENALPPIQGDNTTHLLSDRNIAVLGDSIFGNNQTATGVMNLFADYTGANVANFAFGGTQGAIRTGSSALKQAWAKFDGVNVANAIANNDYSDMVDAIESGVMDEPSYFSDTVDALEAYDWSSCEYIIFGYGTNDWTAGTSVATFKNAMKQIVQTILTAYPNIVMIDVTPFMRFFESGGVFYNSSVYDYRGDGVYLEDFVDACYELKEQPYNLQVVDGYNIGINDYTRTGFFTASDWTHHDARGRKRIATYLANKIC